MQTDVAQNGVVELTQAEIEDVDGGLLIQVGRFFVAANVVNGHVSVGYGSDQGSHWYGF